MKELCEIMSKLQLISIGEIHLKIHFMYFSFSYGDLEILFVC